MTNGFGGKDTEKEMKLSEQLKQDHECGDFGRALAGYSERAERLERAAEIYAAERDHAKACYDRAKACYDRAVRLLTGIHALLYPPRFTDNDGRTWQFKSPLAVEQMQELSDRIRALPDEIEAIDSAMKTPNALANAPARTGD